MKIYKINFEGYFYDDHFFSANNLLDAKKKAEKWAKNQEDEEYGEIDSIVFELETEN